MKPVLETWLEKGLFASRWLMAPMYVGLIVALLALIVIFFQELVHAIPYLLAGEAKADDAIMLALSLIDLSLAGNLVLIVIFAGYENFVSKLDIGETDDRPHWMGTVDFSGLKMKLVASIVAISAIALLKAFLEAMDNRTPVNEAKALWAVVIHMSFVLSGVLLALMDWLASKTGGHYRD